MANRIEEFTRHFQLLKSQAGGSPNSVLKALQREGHKLAQSIHELHDTAIWVDEHRRFSKSRFIANADPKFLQLFTEYEAQWHHHSLAALEEWSNYEIEQGRMLRAEDVSLSGREPEVAGTEPTPPVAEYRQQRLVRKFDPDEHSLVDAVELAEHLLDVELDNADFGLHLDNCEVAIGAFKWLRETVGLDVAEIQRRWLNFPVIVVPKQISDRHNISDENSLFGYLTQIRLAYLIGADLAAIAMCRTATEILIRFHYNNDKDTKLSLLIKLTEERPQFKFLKHYNLREKVTEANKILHFENLDIEHRSPSDTLIKIWAEDLQNMIIRVPAK